jgi:hypothetical protein
VAQLLAVDVSQTDLASVLDIHGIAIYYFCDRFLMLSSGSADVNVGNNSVRRKIKIGIVRFLIICFLPFGTNQFIT